MKKFDVLKIIVEWWDTEHTHDKKGETKTICIGCMDDLIDRIVKKK